MWHEARKQEKKIRGIMVNYKKRAERRRAFYERMKTDPTTFLRIQGSNCKILIDHQNSDSINMMPWQGDKNVMIDRFDVRAHLDYIPQPVLIPQTSSSVDSSEEKKLNYERYRTLVMIEASEATEEGYLKQLRQEEENPRALVDVMEKNYKPAPKATIGYTYEDTNFVMNEAESESGSESDADLDIDVAVNIDELDKEQRDELDTLAVKFGMAAGKYCSLLKADKDEAEHVQKVQDQEEARSQLRGRRAKRDRRSMKENQRGAMSTSPLSYLRKASPSYEDYRESRSRSRSSSSGSEPTKVEYITEFGSLAGKNNHSTGSGQRQNSQNEVESNNWKHGNSRGSKNHKKSRSARRSRSTSNDHHSKYRSRSRSHSRSRSRSPHKRRTYRRSRSRSQSREQYESRDGYSSDKRAKAKSQEKKKLEKAKTSLTGDKAKLTPQEKLKKRMQLALSKQLKIDKKEEKKKKEVKEQERQERDEDLREVSKRWNDRKRYRYSRSRSYSPEYRS